MTAEPTAKASVGSDRRGSDRRKIRQVLEIEWGSATMTGLVRDIGPGGLFVELSLPLWMGATFSGRLMIDPSLKMNCTVRRIEPHVGIAVTFDLPEENGQARLEELLATLPQA